MTKKNKTTLPSHDQLRYDYLRQNRQYLTADEQQELEQLQARLMASPEGGQFSPTTNDLEVPQHGAVGLTPRRRQKGKAAKQARLDRELGSVKTGSDKFTARSTPLSTASEPPTLERQDTVPSSAGAAEQSQPTPTDQSVDQSSPIAGAKPKMFEKAAFSKTTVSHAHKPVTSKQKQTARRRGRLKQFFKFIALLLTIILIGMGGMFLKGLWGVQSGSVNLQPAAKEFFDGQPTRDGTNILILGSDHRVTEGAGDARTDTIMVMNVGNRSGKIKLVSFMRDTLVNIEGVSYPGTVDSKINSAFTIGEQNNNQGAELMRQTLKANFDIDVQYYVMIDFETFAVAIDTLFPNGVQMDAQFSTVNGEAVDSVDVPDDLGFASSGSLYQTIAVGPQRMDGKTLLNYARFRSDDEGDFGRTRRQQEVMQAVLSQVKDPTKLFTGSEALGKVYALTSTNVAFPFVLKNGLPALVDGQKGIERMTVPQQGDWLDEYDRYGGLGLLIDFEFYKERLAELGLR